MRGAILLASLLVVTALGCAGGDVNDPSTYGTLKAQIVSAPKQSGNVDKVMVTVVKVTAHSTTAGWVTLSTTKQTIDLLQLATDGLPIGQAQLPAGKITQFRLYTAEGGPNYVQLKNGQQIELKVPSGVQSGIKVKGPVDIGSCQTATVQLQLDGNKSIHVHPTGQGDLWILRPVIKLAKVDSQDTACPTGTPGGSGGGSGVGTPGSTGGTGGSVDGGTDPFDDGNGGSVDGGTASGGTGTPTGANGGAGAACTAATQCLSGNCVSGTCAPSGPGGACLANADCTTNVCTNNSCDLVPAVGGAGSACTNDSECTSFSCVGGVCDVGGTGAACRSNSDCDATLNCVSGSCAPQIN